MTLRSSRLLAALAVMTSAMLVGACGGDDAAVVERAEPVAAELAPAEVAGGLKLYESTSDETLKAFTNAGDSSLVADGRLWEIRKSDRLVGALQISTVKRKVDLTKARRRDAIVDEILIGSIDRIRSGDVEVYTSAANDKVVYLWFGVGVYEVLQLKGDELDHNQVLADVVAHQRGQAAWRPLPSDVEVETESDE